MIDETKQHEEVQVEHGDMVVREHAPPISEAVGFQTKEEVDRFMEAAERKVEVLQKLKILALKATKPSDWVDEAGSPYLQATGSEAVAHVFGLSIVSHRSEKTWSDDKEGRYYIYKHYAQIGLAGRIMDIQGKCSQRDKFLSMQHGRRVEPDETNIDQKAYSNMLGNGIKRFLGLRNVTWEDLEEVGIAKSDVKSVEYKNPGGKKTGEAKTGKGGKDTGKEKPTGTIDEARIELAEIIGKLYGSGNYNLRRGVRELSGFKNDKGDFICKEDIADLSRNWLFRTLGNARDELAAKGATGDDELPADKQPPGDEDVPF